MTNETGSTLGDDTIAHLRERLGEDAVILDRDRLLAYESDALTYIRGRPLAALLPASADEVQQAVRALAEAKIPFVPRGAGTGISAGAVPRDAVVLSTARLDRVLEIDAAGRRADVEPGVITGEISEAAAPFGLRYLPDPSSATACTIGGNVGYNAGGPHCLRHGVTNDHVLELDVVLPDGELVTLGRGERGGLDLAGLVIGSEGTLGIVTRIAVQLYATAPAVRTALVLFDSMERAAHGVGAILTEVTPVALEMIDRATIRLVEDAYGVGLPTEAAAALILEVEGFEDEVEAEIGIATRAAERTGAHEVRHARDEEERAGIWRARKGYYGALGRISPEVVAQDATVPRSKMPSVLVRIDEIAARHGLRQVTAFHAGDGNLHPNLLYDHRDPEQVRAVEQAGREIMQVCVEAGGTITGEHGVGLDKKSSMRLIFSSREIDVLRTIKRAWDPAALCNADKMIPEAT